jgi:hypothetical protein
VVLVVHGAQVDGQNIYWIDSPDDDATRSAVGPISDAQ